MLQLSSILRHLTYRVLDTMLRGKRCIIAKKSVFFCKKENRSFEVEPPLSGGTVVVLSSWAASREMGFKFPPPPPPCWLWSKSRPLCCCCPVRWCWASSRPTRAILLMCDCRVARSAEPVACHIYFQSTKNAMQVEPTISITIILKSPVGKIKEERGLLCNHLAPVCEAR